MASPISPSYSPAPAQGEAGRFGSLSEAAHTFANTYWLAASEACPERDPSPAASEACPERPPYEKGTDNVVCVLKAAASGASGISPAVVAACRQVSDACQNVLLLGEAAADLVREKAVFKGGRRRWEEAAATAEAAVKNLESAQENFRDAAGRLEAAGLAAELHLDALRQELRCAPEPPQPPKKRSRN